MAVSIKISTGENGVVVDKSLYKSMIGSLLYLTANRPDINYNVGVCSRFQANLKESHLNAVKGICWSRKELIGILGGGGGDTPRASRFFLLK